MSECYEQLSVFDFFNTESLPSLDEAIALVSEKFGIKFFKECWEWMNDKVVYVHTFNKKSTLEIYESKYTVDDMRRFISVNWNGHNEGFGMPCDSMEEVCDGVKRAIERTRK